MSRPSIDAVFPDSRALLKDRQGEARFSVVPDTNPPVCVLYLVREAEKKIDLVAIRTWREQSS